MKTYFIARAGVLVIAFYILPTSDTAGRNNNYALQINEVMSNSKAGRGLPKYEYIEIYNRSDKAVELSNWTVTIGKHTKTIPKYRIEPKDFLVISTPIGADSLANYCHDKVLGIKSLPSLLHSGTSIVLNDQLGRLISILNYKNAWFGKTEKAKGGWSLEQIDPNNPCGGESNWKPSTDPSGGTPGRVNSVDDKNPDSSPPEIKRVFVLNEKALRLFFTKSMDSSTILKNDFLIDNDSSLVFSVKTVPPAFKAVEIIFEKALEYKRTYTLSTKGISMDCAGNAVLTTTYLYFGLPEICNASDIIINEILFDPKTGGASFVEIRNRSKKFIDLKGISFVKSDPLLHTHESSTALSDDGYLLFPDDYLILTAKPASVQQEFPLSKVNKFLQVEKLPALNRNHGEVTLKNQKEEIIDALTYSKAMHFNLLKSTKGVSLERMDSERLTQDSSNWHSASEQSGFATPGYRNSEDLHTGANTDMIFIDPEIFSPDQDGYQDVLTIAFNAPAPSGTCSIWLFDAGGQLVRQLVKNELAASQTFYTWDGLNSLSEKAAIGAYLLYAEFFDSTTGTTYTQKLRCILAGKLD